MSYDIALGPSRPGRRELTPERRAALVGVLDRIAARLAGLLGGWERHDPAVGPLVGRLTAEEGGVRVSLYDGSALVSVLGREQAAVAAVAEVVRVITEETGYAYDARKAGDGVLDVGRAVLFGIGVAMLGVLVLLLLR
ncbi:hypothetical protein [Nocardioides humi]|uniref:Uncharacterized protein n=1 Tax=Nocardioides humi TaxID=449461 RepID=A0ABN2ANI5_9ACTN|nr:hypothetical protein [Nocardioides humi]